MDTVSKSAVATVISHHLMAFVNADVDEIMKDYSEESQLFTPDGALNSLEEIRDFFEYIFKIIPKGSTLEIKQKFVSDDISYLAWSCESPFVSIPLGTDSFIITNGIIMVQTLAAHIIRK